MSIPVTQIEPVSLAPHKLVTPMEMMDRAISTGAGVEVLERLMSLQERHQQSESRKAFNLAIAAAKREIPVIAKNRNVNYEGRGGAKTSYNHEDLGEIARTVDPILSAHGLSYRFRTSVADGGLITVTCILSHEQGHFEENALTAGRDESGNKNNLQAVGSTQTYLQRYTLKAALGLAAAKDDDGESAGRVIETVTDDQADTLRSMIQQAGADINALLKHYRAESLSDFPLAKFQEAKGLLQIKINKLKEMPIHA